MNKKHKINKRSTTGIWIRCPNPICGNYEWQYRGRFFLYATCPSCRRNIRISSNKIEIPLQSAKVGDHDQIVTANIGGATARSSIDLTSPLSTTEDIRVSISNRRKFLKKAFHISGKTIVVIHPHMVERLGINDSTWLEEEITENGIFLRISHWPEGSEVETK